MSLDFLKAVTAKVEGRTAVVIGGLAFCCFNMWIATRLTSPIVSAALIAFAAALGCAVVLIPLTGKPQPSEPSPKFIIVGNQTIYTGGHHSTDEMINLLREARNIRPLPAPSALVIGSPQDQQYQALSASEAEQLQRTDELGVDELLRSEVETIRSRIRSAQLGSGPAQDTQALHAQNPRDVETASSQAVITDRSSISGDKASGGD